MTPERRYLKRAAGLLVDDILVQVSPYLVSGNGNVVDGDGLYGEQPFDKLADLVTLAKWNEDDAKDFMVRLHDMVNSRK